MKIESLYTSIGFVVKIFTFRKDIQQTAKQKK